METGIWHLEHKSGIMRQVRFAFRHYRKLLAQAYGKAEGEAIARETMERFEALLPGVPYRGGDENRLTRTLYMAAAWLVLYRTLWERGETAEGGARLLYEGGSRFMSSLPVRLLLRWEGRRMLGHKAIEKRRHEASVSRLRRHADDWVFDFVEGHGQAFEYGVDCTECGIVKYLGREGAPELAQVACWLDYPAYAARRVRLIRTETIAQGGHRCDFRFGRGQPEQVEPEFLHV